MKKESLMEKEQVYRSNVSLITFRGSEFLLVNLLEWPPDYWKFPQGGVNPKESLEQAAKREFQEELGTDKMKIIGRSKIKKNTKRTTRSISKSSSQFFLLKESSLDYSFYRY